MDRHYTYKRVAFQLAQTLKWLYGLMNICPFSNMSTPKKKILSPAQMQAVARMFAVLSEPSRLALLQALHNGPLSVSQLIESCRMKQANVSKQLAVLFAHHLVRRERNGLSVRYEIEDPMVFSLCALVCGKMERDTREAAEVFHPEI